jgi:hypothetical protein
MAGFTGNNRRLGSAGIPPAADPPVVTETTNTGTDSFYIAGLAFAEDIAPNGAANPPVNAKATTNTGTDSFYVLAAVFAESGAPGSSGGTFNVTETGTAGADTYYILGMVFGET